MSVVIPRGQLVVGVLGLVLACVALVWLASQAMRERALERLAARELDELALLAGVVDDAGVRQRDEPLVVEVVQDGGSLWIAPAVARAVDASGDFATGNSRHLLRVEVLEHPRALALQLNLWRAGWQLRVPEPLRVRTSPWVVVVALALAACVAPLVRRISLALALAGVVAQVLLVLVAPPPDLFAPLTLAEEWRRGPLFGWLVPALERLTPLQLAIAVAIVALCLVLVGFDHRRSRAGDDALDLASASLFALLGALGLVALLEAALRSSFAAALVHWSGMLALLGLLLAWLPALAQAHQRWQMERRAAQPTTTPPAPTSEHAS